MSSKPCPPAFAPKWGLSGKTGGSRGRYTHYITHYIRKTIRCGLVVFWLVWVVLRGGAGDLAAADPADQRPNLLFVLSDNQRWDFMSCMGHPFLETPNMDRLAREGILFTNAFVTTSVCSPSRASFLTGRYAHTHGIRNNITPWDGSYRTFLEILHDAGYDTAFIGKWHMPGRLPRLQGVDPFVTFTIQGGQGRYMNCPLVVNGREEPSRKPYITEELTDRAIEFIERPREGPFCLYLSHKAVHHRWIPPPHLAHLYDDKEPAFPEDFNPWILLTRGHIWEGTIHGSAWKLYRDYCRTIAVLDEQLGRLLDRLDALGLSENTLVVYAGDNGFFWGEHHLFGTGRWPYEESIRIPFIVRYPRAIPDPGRRAKQMVLNIDLAPTFLEAAGIPVPDGMEGKSLLPVLRSAAAPGRKAFLYEYFKDFPYRVPPTRAVRTERYMYIEYEGRRGPELYDLENDSGEEHNLIDTAGGRAISGSLRELMESFLEGGQGLERTAGGDRASSGALQPKEGLSR